MSEAEANKLMEEGEKQITKFAPFTSGEEKREKARNNFLKAATQYKAANNWLAAAMAYKRCAEMSIKNKIEIDIADDLLASGNAYLKAGSPDAAAEMLGQVVDMYDKAGKYSQAAKTCVTLGEMGGRDSEKWFQRAITYLRNEGSTMQANEIVQKIMVKNIEAGQYETARQQYEKMGTDYLEGNLTRSSARKFFFMSLLCQVAMLSKTNLNENLEFLRAQFEKFQDLDPQFTSYTREHMLIDAIIEAIEEDDIEKYTEAVCDYDNIVPMDGPKQKMLMLGKRCLMPSSPNRRLEEGADDISSSPAANSAPQRGNDDDDDEHSEEDLR